MRGFCLKRVSLLRSACFPLKEGQYVDLRSVFFDLRSVFGDTIGYDEEFWRIILKKPNFTLTFFRSGKVMVFGLASNSEVENFLNYVWIRFFLKKLAKPLP